MVFNVAEEVNQPDQASVVKGRQRKHSGRKSKSALANLNSRSKEATQTTGTAKHGQTGTVENDMGNTSTQETNKDMPTLVMNQGPQQVEGLISAANAIVTDKDLKDNHLPNNGGNENELSRTSLETDTTGILDAAICTDSADNGSSPEAEIARLKQLLLLQVSLISRQQDLLRLRDREIMQLKASNANYKCQLSRVRRRMSKRRSDGTEESPKSSKRKPFEGPSEVVSGEQEVMSTPRQTVPESSESLTLSSQGKPEESGQKAKKRRLDLSEDLNSATDLQNTPSTSAQKSMDISSSPSSVIEQKQAELMQAMMVSPPDKAIKTFCDITNSSPPLDEYPFKICDRCPHCVAIAQEITRLLRSVEKAQQPPEIKPKKIMKDTERELVKMAGVALPTSDDDEHKGVRNSIMKTMISYHRISPMFDQNHWWWDLECGSIKMENALKIPTWKEQEIAPLPFENHEEVTEVTNDQAFTKRHSKLEQDERRRKRWDIQRIREYRYNEKLRQKLLKQGAVYDAPVIESFSGHLHDAESVEVQETLPVNIFGYPAPHMDPEEFDLAPMRESFKSMVSSVGRKRQKRT